MMLKRIGQPILAGTEARRDECRTFEIAGTV